MRIKEFQDDYEKLGPDESCYQIMKYLLESGNDPALGINFLNAILNDYNWDKQYAVSLFGKSLSPFIKSLPNYSEQLTFIQGDYTHKQDVQKALQGQDIVYHFISETFPHTSWDNVQLEVEKNV